MRKHAIGLSLIAVATSLAYAAPAMAQQTSQDQSEQDSETPEIQEQPITLPDGEGRPDELVVTGSRLKDGDPTTTVTVITREDIEARGVTSVTDLIRTLPQNLATIGNITNERTKGPLSDRYAPVGALGSLGVSAANLGGLGAGNTLVLINGRRIAGAAGIEDGFVNLNNIPLAAIERVEITASGASAIYGADAIGGVINFILRQNYTGTTLTAQHEYSENDQDTTRVSAYSRFGWNSGSIAGTVSYSRSDPLNNYKSGYVTDDYSDAFGGDPFYDGRSFTNGLQPGVIPQYTWDPVTFQTIETGITVPEGFEGVPTLADMITVGREAVRDYVPELAGPRSETYSATLNFEQKITDRLTVAIDGLYNRTKNWQEQDINNGIQIPLAPGQYYNPFPAYYFSSYDPGATVYLYPEAEIAAGIIEPGNISNTAESWSINGQITYDFDDDTQLEFVYSRSKSKSSASQDSFSSLVSLIADATSPNGVRCYNYFLQSGQGNYSDEQRAYLQEVFDRQCQAATSTDPDLAFNPWKSTPEGSGSSITDFFYHQDDEQRSSTRQNFEGYLRGALFELPAGKLRYVIGGEYADDGVDSREVSARTGTSQSRDHYAFYGELQIPVFGGDFHLPLMHSLLFSVAGRRDTYITDGAVGTVDNIPVEDGGEIVYERNKFTEFTPSLGVLWSPVSGLSLRGRWTTGFQAPPPTQLFNVSGATTYNDGKWIVNDPLYNCRANGDCDFDYGPDYYGYWVDQTTAPNPDLKPQRSTQYSLSANWTPGGALYGLNLSVRYNYSEIRNQYSNVQQLAYLLSEEEVLQMEQFYPRDENGKITAYHNMIYNISGSKYSSITYEASYTIPTGIGTFEPRVLYLDNLKSETRAFDESEPESTLGTVQGNDEYKIVGSLSWRKDNWSAVLWARYTPGYVNDYYISRYGGVISNPQDAQQVDSFTTFDLTATWQATERLRFNLAGRNIFAADPPFAVVQYRPYDAGRYDPAGRRVSVQLEYSF